MSSLCQTKFLTKGVTALYVGLIGLACLYGFFCGWDDYLHWNRTYKNRELASKMLEPGR